MATIHIEHKKDRKIRRYLDEENNARYFAVVDVIGILTDSEDAQNYWKVFKSRLKKKDRGLVARVQPLRMRARAGKNYITDTADRETMISIVKYIPKISIESLELLRKSIEEGTLPDVFEDQTAPRREQVGDGNGAKLLIDGYETENSIFIEAMLAGVSPENVLVSIEKKKVTIKGKREKATYATTHPFKSYICEELEWVDFSRVITLPHSIQTDKIKTKEERGHLIIELAKVRQQL